MYDRGESSRVQEVCWLLFFNVIFIPQFLLYITKLAFQSPDWHMVESIFEYGFHFVEIFGSKFLLRVVFDTTDIRISLKNRNTIGKYLCLVVLGDHKSSFHEYGRGEIG